MSRRPASTRRPKRPLDWDRFEELRRWLRDESRPLPNPVFNQDLLDRLHDCGLPIDRVRVAIPSLHPQFDSYTLRWTEETGFEPRPVVFDERVMGLFARSPYQIVIREGKASRTRIGPEPVEGEFGVIADLRDQGMTDYIVLPMTFSDGSHKGFSLATMQEGGFTDEEVSAIEELSRELAPALEIRILRQLAATLLDTYVGPTAGAKVLQGRIKRGDGEKIRAAIWFSDLRGFTALSETLREQHMLALLNDYFDVVTTAIEQQGGEILKFIGDAVLAVFLPDDCDEDEACQRALAAVVASRAALSERNAKRQDRRERGFDFSVALHFGDVYYGNVGAQNRLDFTVIGPAVNLASRIEGLCKDLQRPCLVSAEFAALHGGSFEALGEFSFKGISEARSVYAPREES